MLPLFNQPDTSPGPRSMLAFWMGGAAAVAITTQGGVRSMLAPWAGGATSAVSVSQGGVRSMLAFWAGGAVSGETVAVAVTTSTGSGNDFHRTDHLREQIEREDREILDMVTTILTTQDLWQQ